MVKLWFKIMQDNKIVKQTTISHDEKFTYANFGEYISEGCYALDADPAYYPSSHNELRQV